MTDNKKICLVAINSKYIHTNLAIRCLKNSIVENSNITIVEKTINNNLREVLDNIISTKPAYVGFSCYIWNIEYILKLASSLKKVLPDTQIFFGGPQVSFDYINIMKKHRFIDYITFGEGEISFPKFVDYINGKDNIINIEGICYRHDDLIKVNSLISKYDLDNQFFLYDDLKEYTNQILYYETSRGCPFQCSYCMSGNKGNISYMKLDKVISSFEIFIKANVKQVKLVDRTFNYPMQRSIDILNAITRLKKKYPTSKTQFHFEINPVFVNDDFIDAIKDIDENIIQFEIGVQSTNKETLDAIGRHYDINSSLDNIKKITKGKNIKIYVDLIAGLPHETYDIFKKSFNDVFALKADVIHLGFLKILSGSTIETQVNTHSINYENHSPYQVLSTKYISYEQLVSLEKIESVLDTYINSSRFNKSITYALTLFPTPFDFLEIFSKFLEQINFFETQHKFNNLFNYFFEFIKTYKPDSNILYIKNTLLYDWVINQKPRNYPSSLDFQLSEETKKFARSFYNDKTNIDKYLRTYMDMSASTISRQCHIIKFDFDMLNDYNGVSTSSYILFDYKKPISSRSVKLN